MLERLHIRNYRVFNDLKIDQLSRINLIAGKNNSGKTSLLEAIFLLAGGGNPQLAVNTNVIRGVPDAGVPQQGLETFWKQLFSALDMSLFIEIVGYYTSHGQLTLKINTEQPSITELPLDRTGGSSVTDLSDGHSLIFQYSDSTGTPVKRHIRLMGPALNVDQPVTPPPFNATILSSRTGNIQEDAVRLGRLRQQKQGHLLLEALQVIEPKLQSIEDNSALGMPMIWGDSGLPELIPLSAMGEGMSRIARLVLGIASAMGGVVLVDEIENGLHHSILSKVWKVVDTAAKQFNTQIFATTHSFECAEAAHEALGSDGFRLHRLEVSGTENRCVTYEPEAIAATLKHDLEFR